MEKTQFVVCDTNIVIELFKHNPIVIDKCLDLGMNNLVLSAVTVGEFYAGVIDRQELLKVRKHLDKFPFLHLNETISETAIRLMERFCLSHHPQIPDMLIAATALYYEIPVYTLNIKDFRYISGIQIV